MKILVNLALLVVFTFAYEASACSCKKRSMAEKFEAAYYIALVKVTGIEATEIIQEDVPHQKLNFKTREVLKGYYPEAYFYTHVPSSGFCGGDMQPDTEYVVFINSQGYTSICSGTFLMEQGSVWSMSKYAEINALRSQHRTQKN